MPQSPFPASRIISSWLTDTIQQRCRHRLAIASLGAVKLVQVSGERSLATKKVARFDSIPAAERAILRDEIPWTEVAPPRVRSDSEARRAEGLYVPAIAFGQ